MNSFGKIFRITLYGESHQEELGIIIENVLPGLQLDFEEMTCFIERRKPKNIGTTSRKESDIPLIKSGYFNSCTTGSPLVIAFKNENKDSSSYEEFVNHPRPSHADLVNKEKYFGFNDYRGGGQSSGRMTLAITAAGYVAMKMSKLEVSSKLLQVGTLTEMSKLDDYLEKIKNDNDSVGGIVEVCVKNCPKNLGEPFFEGAESMIASLLFSIPGVKGVEFGVGFKGINLLGSEYNDTIINSSGKTNTNNSGGINGGITNGNELIVKIFLRPSSSIGKEQLTYNFIENKLKALRIKGRHDACYARRTLVVLESAVLIALTDLMLLEKRFGR